MNRRFLISREEWDKVIAGLLVEYDIYASVLNDGIQDYQLIQERDTGLIVYNRPKPTTPLKTFFLPVKENVIREVKKGKQRIIIGVPSCDLAGLNLIDSIYLDDSYPDLYYQDRRDNTILIGTDCFSVQEHCHCTSYGIQPVAEANSDISVLSIGENMMVCPHTEKGMVMFNTINSDDVFREPNENELKTLQASRDETIDLLERKNHLLPDTNETGRLIRKSRDEIWKKYSLSCVSCGACATICPTCTCFLLIDRPGFEKIRHLDACQYPAFERVAAGEDPLKERHKRFRNRYLCKYVWKPEKYNHVACTGCGRCIEACIGEINKNELFMELSL
ncbi:MAG: 4Fe-4S dicluster domain-containing protein [Bacteroidales bacterium]|nr:MAG: 4Fe-4S dicluster domain-containing protein [Bacteroidales bacterium]